jgi:RecG-like helicase
MADKFLTTLFSPKSALELEKIGITNLYQFITYFPSNLTTIEPFSQTQFDSKTKYIANLKLLNFVLKKGKKPFFLLEFQSEFGGLTAYYFTTAKYVFSQLIIGQSYQVILNYKSPFWNIDRLAILQPVLGDKFILGKAKLQTWLIPNYPRILGFTSNKFVSLHQKLPTQDYILNLQELIPDNNLIPQNLSLFGIHRPVSMQNFLETKKQYLIFKVFLQEITFRYIDSNLKQKQALAGVLETEFLKGLSSSIPYQLTHTQKTTIWEILQDLCPN